MKYILLALIQIYQMIPGPWHNHCRFYPSCSNYAKEAIIYYGGFKGCFLSLKRILRCNPFHKPGYDPVIKERKHEKNTTHSSY